MSTNSSKSASSAPKNGANLLQQWKDAVRHSYLPFLLIKAFEKRDDFARQPSNLFVLLEIQFDYNFRTFIPIKPASLNPLTVLPDPLQQQMKTAWGRFPPTPKGYFDHLVLLKLKDNDAISVIPCRVPEKAFELKHPLEHLVRMIRKEIKLQSPIFDSWPAKIKHNVTKQTDMFRNPTLVRFLTAALHMETIKPRHKDYAVTFLVDMGLGLMQIREIRDFNVVKVADLHRGIRTHPGFTAQQKEHYVKDVLNLSGKAPSLANFDKGSVLLPVVFVNSLTKDIIYVQPNGSVYDEAKEMSSKKKKITTGEADAQASALFRQLTSIPIPPVMNPPIQ